MTRLYHRLKFAGLSSGGSPTTFRYATRTNYQPTAFDPGPIPTSWAFSDGRLRAFGSINEECLGGNRVSGPMDVVQSALALENGDGGLDTLRDYSFDDEAATYSLADADGQDFDYASFPMRVEQCLLDEDSVTVSIRSYRSRYDTPLMTLKYAGTNTGSPLGGIEGVADDLKGHPKPKLYGKVFNISPFLVNTAKLIYQVHGGALTTGWTMTVYDKRAALTAGADYASQATMESTAPAAGQYRVHPATGCFRVGSTPAGRITCDVTNPPLTSTDPDSVLEVTKVLLDDSAVEHNLTTNAKCGIYLTDEVQALDALSDVLLGLGAYVHYGRNPAGGTTNKQTIRQINAPSSLPYTPDLDPIDLDVTNIIPGSLQQVVQGDGSRGLPVWRVNLNYKRNYTVMGDADLAGVALADAQFCKQQWRTISVEDAAVQTQWPKARELVVNSLLTDATQATSEANRLLTCFKVKRDMYQLQVHREALRLHPQFVSGAKFFSAFQISVIVRITLSRFGLSAGKQFVVIAMQRDIGTDIYTLTVWG